MFGAPLFLIAALAGAFVPLILHLLQKKKTVSQVFPTLRFLKIADRHSSRRIRMENLLLWLLRTLIMVLLGLAFAMPMLRAGGLGFLGRTARDVAIVLDASYSMLYQVGQKTVWERALEAAADIIKGLDANDRFCIYLALENPGALIAEPVGDRARGLAQLEGLKPGYDTSCLAAALAAAHDALKKVPRRRERELHILTDNQALAWKGFTEQAAGETTTGQMAAAVSAPRRSGRWDPGAVDKRTACFVGLLGAASPANIAPRDIALVPPATFAGSPARLIARIGCSGDAPETTLSLCINEKEIARRTGRTGGAGLATTSFVVPPLPAGVHAARVESPADNLPIDNVFHFLIRVMDQLPALCVGHERDTVFLRAALQAGAGGTPPRRILPEQLAEEKNLGAYSCIFLVNALPLSGQIITALERYVSGGGLLVFFPGSRGSLEDYRAWDCLPGVPSEIMSFSSSESGRTLNWGQAQHPLLHTLRESMASPRLSVQRALAWKKTHSGAQALISAGPGRPFLLQRDYSQGSVLMFSVGADRAWSNFPLSPFFLPLVMQIVEYSGGVGAQSPFVWCGESLALDEILPGAAADTALLDPEGRPVSIRGVTQAGRAAVYAAALELPGIYRLAPSGGRESSAPALAANFSRAESDLTPVDPGRLASLLGIKNLYTVTDRETLQRAIREHRVGRTYGEHLLFIALLLIGIEFFYANMLSRKKPDLSGLLGLTSAGKLNGKSAAGAKARRGEAGSDII
ncbi:MAG: VWA domain-containing protein [Kiritimatiellae bacterium]|nr:VWA domain-containing protein [Kiritimatiellia bacterium]